MVTAVSYDEQREQDAAAKRESRAAARDLKLPKVKDKKRREACLSDCFEFLRVYRASTYTRPLTVQQREIVETILNVAMHGGSAAIAAPRGEGKTTIAQDILGVYCVVNGILKFPVIGAATGPHAERILGNIKRQYTRNKLLLEDFPEICYPLWDLRQAPQRALSQTVHGKPTFSQWAGDQVVFPTVDGSLASGTILMTRGLDAAIRGLLVDDRRPDCVLIDDPETRESAQSEDQCQKRELIIEEDIAGLGGQNNPMAMVMLTTIQNRDCLSSKYTDTEQKPTWSGKRFRLVEKWPERMGLCDDYVALYQANVHAGDKQARGAHQFYLTNQHDIEDGAELANPYRFIAAILPDGSQQEVSALQHCLNIIAKRGRDHFDTEYQNDPPESAGPVESGITANRIQRQVSGYDRKVIPPGCIKLTCGVDVRKVALHWVVRAWRADGTGFTIDYGIYEVHGTTVGTDEGVDEAVYKAIKAFVDEIKHGVDYQFATVDGEVMPVNAILIDAGWRTQAVYAACMESGLGVRPVMGFGKSSGCVQANFYDVQRSTQDKKPGDGWFLSRKGNVWLVCADSDRWKAWEHDRWMTSPERPGTMMIYGQPSESRTGLLSADEKGHHSYAKHITNEVEIEEPYKGTMRRRWKAKSENTHWLDASYYANVGANMEGIRLLPTNAKVGGKKSSPSDMPSARDLAAMTRRRA